MAAPATSNSTTVGRTTTPISEPEIVGGSIVPTSGILWPRLAR